MIMKSVVTAIAIVGLSISVAACEKKEVKSAKSEPVKKEVVVLKLSLESLDRRVSVLEEARAKANANARAAKKYTPAPKYDPNFK